MTIKHKCCCGAEIELIDGEAWTDKRLHDGEVSNGTTSTVTQRQINRIGRQTRIGMLLLRVAGFSVKETNRLLGLDDKVGFYHWREAKRKSGHGNFWELAEMVKTTPQNLWPV